MEQELLLPLLIDDRLAHRVKLEDFLMVALGIRGCSQLLIPGELPDARAIVDEIDRVFSHKYYHGVAPDSGPVTGFIDRAKYAVFRAVMHPLRYKATLIRETLDELLLESDTYRAHKHWASRLELDLFEAHLRPSINETFIYRTGQLGHIQELSRLRKEIRDGAKDIDFGSTEMSSYVFPEQHSMEYVTMLGTLLDYPSCCVERYVVDRRAGVLPELRGAEQLEDIGDEADIPVEAYFARDFVPCKPTCPEAQAIGQQTLDAFAGVDPQRLIPRYRGVLRANQEHIQRYPSIIEEQRRRLRGELADIRHREGEPHE